MARMIPPAPPGDTPDSERRFFVKLAGEPGTEDWVAFHSLGLSSAYTGHFGEIDFVILIPGRGIVCVEVKGGGVAQRAGIWTSRNRSGVTHELKRSPFAQAKSAMFKLRRAVEDRFGSKSTEARIPSGYIVALPDVDCPPPCPEFSRRDVLDRQDMEKPIAGLISECPTLCAAVAQSRASLGPAPFNNLKTFFRPDFDRIVAAGATLKPVEESLQALTEEQYAFLDTVDLNNRCILVGPAGSGKTTLAVEYARRLSGAGKSVLLGCFNKRLGEWLGERGATMGPGRVVGGSIHKLLADRIRVSSFAEEFRKNRGHPDLFSEIYPLYGAMAIDEQGETFDAVLIDEAQDFRSEMLVALADTWTARATDAKIVLLGDYTQQAIYDTPRESLDIARSALEGSMAVPLRKNCRNTRRIAVQTSNLSSFHDLQLYGAQPEGDAVETFFFKDTEDQAQRVGAILVALRKEGVAAQDIVVLGKYRYENSGIRGRIPNSPWQITDAEAQSLPKNTVVYSTIHSFKGLESSVVVLVDVDCLDEGEGESLLYVGMSRARVRLYMLVSAQCRQAYDRKILQGLRELV